MTSKETLNELNYLIHESPERVSTEVMEGLKDAVKCIEDMQERIDIMTEGIEPILKFKDKSIVTFPRLHGKTAGQLQEIMDLINMGKPVAVVSKDKTTEFNPVICCKDCKNYDGEGTCLKNGIAMLNGDWFCADAELKGGDNS